MECGKGQNIVAASSSHFSANLLTCGAVVKDRYVFLLCTLASILLAALASSCQSATVSTQDWFSGLFPQA